MSAAAFSSGDFASTNRRAVARRLAVVAPAAAVQAVAAQAASVPFPPAPARTVTIKRPSNTVLAIALVLVAHVAVLEYLKHRPVPVAAPVALPPVAVELTVPPVVTEPPKPLPQKKVELPPPPPPQTPHLDLPPPPPVQTLPAPATPQTPVVQAPPPAPLAPAPVVPAPVPETPAVGYAGYLNNPQPDYPQFAIDQGWEGRVMLSVHVLATGHADHVDVKHGSGHKLLDEIAAKTVLQRWAFLPAKRGSAPVDGWVDVPIDFKLSN